MAIAPMAVIGAVAIAPIVGAVIITPIIWTVIIDPMSIIGAIVIAPMAMPDILNKRRGFRAGRWRNWHSGRWPKRDEACAKESRGDKGKFDWGFHVIPPKSALGKI
jgi:hypothetical protein